MINEWKEAQDLILNIRKQIRETLIHFNMEIIASDTLFPVTLRCQGVYLDIEWTLTDRVAWFDVLKDMKQNGVTIEKSKPEPTLENPNPTSKLRFIFGDKSWTVRTYHSQADLRSMWLSWLDYKKQETL